MGCVVDDSVDGCEECAEIGGRRRERREDAMDAEVSTKDALSANMRTSRNGKM